MDVEFGQEHIALHDRKGEIVRWVMDEWVEDPSVVLSIVNAVHLGHLGVDIREVTGGHKPTGPHEHNSYHIGHVEGEPPCDAKPIGLGAYNCGHIDGMPECDCPCCLGICSAQEADG